MHQCTSWNGIEERNHRSIKTITARKQCSIPEVIYWYNVTPKDSLSPVTATADALHRYDIQAWGIDPLKVCSQYKLMESHAMWKTSQDIWTWQWKPSCGYDSDLEESGPLLNLGEPDDLSEDGMTSLDDSPNPSGQNAEWPDDPLDSSFEDKAYIVHLRRSTKHKRPAPSYSLCDHEIGGSVAKGKMNYLSDPICVLPVDVQ